MSKRTAIDASPECFGNIQTLNLDDSFPPDINHPYQSTYDDDDEEDDESVEAGSPEHR